MGACTAMPPGLTPREQAEWELDVDPAAAGLEPVLVLLPGARRDHRLEAWYDAEDDFAIVRVFVLWKDRQKEVRDLLGEDVVAELEAQAQQAHARH